MASRGECLVWQVLSTATASCRRHPIWQLPDVRPVPYMQACARNRRPQEQCTHDQGPWGRHACQTCYLLEVELEFPGDGFDFYVVGLGEGEAGACHPTTTCHVCIFFLKKMLQEKKSEETISEKNFAVSFVPSLSRVRSRWIVILRWCVYWYVVHRDIYGYDALGHCCSIGRTCFSSYPKLPIACLRVACRVLLVACCLLHFACC